MTNNLWKSLGDAVKEVCLNDNYSKANSDKKDEPRFLSCPCKKCSPVVM